MHALPFQSAANQASALASGEISSEELLDIYLSRIDTYNATLNAIVTLDVARARRDARNADAKRASEAELGPLHGLPITLKASYKTAGLRTACGRPDLKEYVPDQDAEAVRRLRAAGAVIIGKTNMPPGNQDVQADNPLFGLTLNPCNTDRTSGGSAGGGAVATAAGLTVLGFGSEIGGSTRIPSHFNGLYGHKVTWRSIPLIGHVRGAAGVGRWGEFDLACAGAQVREARDLVPVLQATVGPPERDGGFSYTLAPPRASRLGDFRVAVWAEDALAPVDRDVEAAVEDALSALEVSGAKVEVQRLPVDMATSHDVFLRLLFGGFTYDRSGPTPASNAALLARIPTPARGSAVRVARHLPVALQLAPGGRRTPRTAAAMDRVLPGLRRRTEAGRADCGTASSPQADRQVRAPDPGRREVPPLLGPGQVERHRQRGRLPRDNDPGPLGPGRSADRAAGDGPQRRRPHHDRVRRVPRPGTCGLPAPSGLRLTIRRPVRL
nr:amidase family protein [Streptomyces sp. NY05-11A]